MTRIFTDGAEFGDNVLWGTGANASSAQARTGTYSILIQNTFSQLSITAVSEFYLRFGIRISAGENRDFWCFRYGSTTLCDLYMTSLGVLTARVNGSTVGTSSQLFSTNTWHLIEVHLKIADSGDFEVKVNGFLEIDYAGDTKPGADTSINNFYVGGGPSFYIDDMAMNDTAGGVDDSWCGDGHIELLTPVSGGTYQWTGSDGDSVDNYALVDDIPATGDDYVKDNVAGHQDIYSLSDFTGTGKVITRVWAECRAKDNDGTSGQIKIGMKSGGVTDLSAAKTLAGVYRQVLGDYETLNPADSAAWEDADLDALQFVVECE